jgi:hypothetical protein
LHSPLTAAKSSMEDKKTFTLTTLSRLDPAASRIAPRFLMHWCCTGKLLVSWAATYTYHGLAHSMCLHVAVNQLHRDRVHWHSSRAVHHSTSLDGLAVDAWERLRSCRTCTALGFTSRSYYHCSVPLTLVGENRCLSAGHG